MTLPHGYEGQGPEHSSARLERFLQLCAEDNMQVCNFTNPAQYYHALRKQVLQSKRKPMIIMSPKSLLRHPQAVCNVEELANGSYKPFIDDENADKNKVNRLIICSGKVYYDILKEMDDSQENVAIARLEQFYPFPNKDVTSAVKSYKKVKHIVWCQEEPKNMGGWTFVAPRIQALLTNSQEMSYAGRQAAASPAAGQKKIHEAEQKKLIHLALGK